MGECEKGEEGRRGSGVRIDESGTMFERLTGTDERAKVDRQKKKSNSNVLRPAQLPSTNIERPTHKGKHIPTWSCNLLRPLSLTAFKMFIIFIAVQSRI